MFFCHGQVTAGHWPLMGKPHLGLKRVLPSCLYTRYHASAMLIHIVLSLYARKRLRLRLQVNTSTDPHCLSLLGRADTLNSSKAPWSAELCSPWRWKRCRQSCPYGRPPLPRTYVGKWDKSCLLLRQLNRISLFYIAELALSLHPAVSFSPLPDLFFPPHTPHLTPQHVSVPPPRLTVPAVALGFWVCLMWCLPLEDETSCWFILTSKGFIWPGSNYTSSGAVLCQGLVCRCLYYTFAVMFVLQRVQWWRTKKKNLMYKAHAQVLNLFHSDDALPMFHYLYLTSSLSDFFTPLFFVFCLTDRLFLLLLKLLRLVFAFCPNPPPPLS